MIEFSTIEHIMYNKDTVHSSYRWDFYKGGEVKKWKLYSMAEEEKYSGYTWRILRGRVVLESGMLYRDAEECVQHAYQEYLSKLVTS